MGLIKLPAKGKAPAKPASDPIGSAFKSLGNAITASTNKTNNEIKQTFTSDKAMAGYKTATNIAIGVASLTPIGKAAATAAILIADKATGGKATDYLGASNSTLNMVPGGALAQAILKTADPNAQNTLNQYDPKKAVMKDAVAIGKTAVTNPSQIVNTTKSVAASNIQSVKNTPAVSTLTKPVAALTPTPKIVPNIAKPSLFNAMTQPPINSSLLPKQSFPPPKKPISLPPPPPPSTLTIVPPIDADKPTITMPVEEVKPTLFTPPPAPAIVADTPPASTLSNNVVLQEALAPPPPPPVPSSSSSMLPMIGLAAVAAIFLLMKR